jgi:DNA-binding GntR family transcriptional regulator
MLHMHFDFLERTSGYLLTDEHDEMIAAIKAKDVDRADALAHAHTRQFRDNFIEFMKENYVGEIALGGIRGAA